MINNIFKFKRIFLSIFITLIGLGITSWFTMPREEDPRLKNRFSNIQTIYPGATAEEVNRLVVKPLEDELSRIEALKLFESTLRAEFSIINLELKANVSNDIDITKAWDDVEDAIETALIDFPPGVRRPQLDRNTLDQDAITISISGGKNLESIIEATKDLEDRLLTTSLVATVHRFSDPDEAIRIDIDEKKLEEQGLDILQLRQKLQLANISTPSGSIRLGQRKITIKTNSSFKSLDDIKNYTFELPNGNNIRLSEVANIKKGIILPRERLFRLNKNEGISLGVVPQKNINLIKFGENVKKAIDQFQVEDKSIKVEIVTFQPGNVKERIDELSKSLLSGIIIIGIALFIAMGFKMSLLSIVLVPSITLVGLSFFGLIGGALHQISIAAFVVSLGLLVDNVIVVLESIQDNLDQGMSKLKAARDSISSLLLPLTAATGTTIASFIPMLGSAGTTADFTRSIPLVVVISLVSSFIIAIVVTPIFGMWFLEKGQGRSWSFFDRPFSAVGKLGAKHPKKVILITTLCLILALSLFPKVTKKFFNDADRSQLVIEMKVLEGTHYSSINDISNKVENFLLEKREVASIAAYIGRGTPRFFYNLNPVPRSPHVAQLILTCKSPDLAKKMKSTIQKELDQNFPEAFIIVRSLAQGPPTKAPIEYRISANKQKELAVASDELVKIIRNVDGAFKVRSNLGVGSPVLYFNINDANSSKYNLERSIVGAKIFARTRGLEVGSFRYDKDIYPIIIGNKKNENFSIKELSKLRMTETRTESVRLESLTGVKLNWEPSVLFNYNGRPTVSVFSEINEGFGFNTIVNGINSQIAKNEILKNVDIQLGGEAAESEEANTAIFKVIPLGVLLLLISLLVQFNSFKKVFIIMGATFPMFIGIIPGLILLNQPFGFFSLLGLLALIGIVVNNGILVVDQIDKNLEEGLLVEEAIEKGVKRRIRPIFLTTLTTVLGLLPLGFTNASLWPPFAWTMIFGLIASMIFTPTLVPSLYKVLMTNSLRVKKLKIQKAVYAGILAIILIPINSKALEVDLFELINYASRHPLLKSQEASIDEREIERKRVNAKKFFPSLSFNARKLYFDENREFVTPIGSFGGVGFDQTSASFNIKQPLYSPEKWNGKTESIEAEKNSLKATKKRLEFLILNKSIQFYSKQLQLKLRLQSLNELIKKLRKQKNEIKRLLTIGRVSEIDLLKIELVLNESLTKKYSLEELYKSSLIELGGALGLDSSVTARKISKVESLFNDLVPKSHGDHKRADIIAINARIESLDLKSKAISYSRLPELSIIGSYNWEDPSALAPNRFGAVGLELTWSLWGAGERSYQKSKITRLKEALNYQKNDLLNSIQSEQSLKRAMLLSLMNEWPQKKQDYQRSKDVVSLEEKRYYDGKSSLNDLLEAEILLQQKREEVLVHPYIYLSSWSDYQTSNDFPELNQIAR